MPAGMIFQSGISRKYDELEYDLNTTVGWPLVRYWA